MMLYFWICGHHLSFSSLGRSLKFSVSLLITVKMPAVDNRLVRIEQYLSESCGLDALNFLVTFCVLSNLMLPKMGQHCKSSTIPLWSYKAGAKKGNYPKRSVHSSTRFVIRHGSMQTVPDWFLEVLYLEICTQQWRRGC